MTNHLLTDHSTHRSRQSKHRLSMEEVHRQISKSKLKQIETIDKLTAMGNEISLIDRPSCSEQPEQRRSVCLTRSLYDDVDHNFLPPEDIDTVYENDGEAFLNALLSLDLAALRMDSSKDDKKKTTELITNHILDKNMFIHNSSQLPLTYDSLSMYKQYYISLMFYNGWAQIVSDFFEKDEEKQSKSSSLVLKLNETTIKGEYCLLFLRTQIERKYLHAKKYKIEENLVLVQVEESRDPTDLANKTKTALGLVLNYNWKLEGDPYQKLNPYERLLFDLKKVEYTVAVFDSTAFQTLLENRENTLTITPICYTRPILRQVETLSSMCYKTDFKNAFLNPDRSVFATNFEQPDNFRMPDDSEKFNSKQKNAIVACFNAVNQKKHLNQTVMIQGPPGTGKTHTLVAIVKSLLLKNNTFTSTPDRILICTPSNGAIDAIALRLLETGLTIVRIGNFDKVHPEVAHCHLQSKVSREQSYAQRKKQEEIVLQSSHVILSTLNSVQNDYMKFFREGNPFRCIIIDEAGQSTEPELLMPLVYPTSKLILIGDHLQLPATVKSNSALSKGYGRSMFERFYCHLENTKSQNGYSASPVITLQRQYRMVEEICRFPSWKFYNDQLETDKTGWNEDIPIYPYLVFDVCNSKEANTASFSKYNVQEATFVCRLIEMIFATIGYNLIRKIPKKLDFTIGIITFYGGQKEELIYQLTKLFNGELPSYIDVNTVDAFQGQERDIVILSCVRAFDGSRGSVGFVESQQRMNVALTRAKSVLYVVLKADSFSQAPNWSELIADATQRGLLKQVNSRIWKRELRNIISYN